jgi:type VI secretion system secreted protein Hcp
MAFDCFLKIDGIDGESTDASHQKWIQVLSFSTGMSQPVSAVQSSSGGATSARVNMQDFQIVKQLDISTPKLAEACCTGKHFPNIAVEICRAGNTKLKYMEYKLSNAIISSISTGGTTGGDDLIPTESVAFNFGKITWAYTAQKREDGSGGGNTAAGWDLQKNAKV